MPLAERFSTIERDIARVKSEIRRISRERSLAYLRGRSDDAMRKETLLCEAQLRNVAALASYVNSVSPPAARERSWRRAITSARFEFARASHDLPALQRWLKEELVPLLNKAEQAAHLVATSLRVEEGRGAAPFMWHLEPPEGGRN
ncbi:MAG: hypothetical protein ACT4OI_04970 [Methanobacteriota archaeon]